MRQPPVVVLYCDNLSGVLPEGELADVDVIIVTSYLPTAAAASAAQANLLRAGRGLGRRGRLASHGRATGRVGVGRPREKAMHESVSGPLLFANDSATLQPRTVQDLTRILARLQGRNNGDYQWIRLYCRHFRK